MTDNILTVVSEHVFEAYSGIRLFFFNCLCASLTLVLSFLHDFIPSVEGAGHRLNQCPGGSSAAEERFLRSHPEDSGSAGC